jgi:predicted secreted protein
MNLLIKNLKDNYLYQRYTVDESCGLGCDFLPTEEKEIAITDLYQETIVLKPYSVNMITLKKKPPEPEKPKEPQQAQESERPQEPEKPKEPQKANEVVKSKEAEKSKETETAVNLTIEKPSGNVTKEIANVTEGPAPSGKVKEAANPAVQGEK